MTTRPLLLPIDKAVQRSSYPPSCDTKFVLKQCVGAGMVREAVQLYSGPGQHELAVELAVSLDTNLAAAVAACQFAPRPPETVLLLEA